MTTVVDAPPDPSSDTAAVPSPQRPTRRWRRRVLLAAGGLLVVGIAVFAWGALQPRPAGFAPTDPDAGAEVTAQWIRYTVDARNRDEATPFDLDAGRVVDPTDPGWDLSFRRTTILTNSGVTGAGGAGVIDLGPVPLVDAVPPADRRFTLDVLAGDEGDTPENPALDGWYSYDFLTHIVSVSDHTYLVHGDTADALVQFDSYYCADEEPACITFRYRLIDSEP